MNWPEGTKTSFIPIEFVIGSLPRFFSRNPPVSPQLARPPTQRPTMTQTG